MCVWILMLSSCPIKLVRWICTQGTNMPPSLDETNTFYPEMTWDDTGERLHTVYANCLWTLCSLLLIKSPALCMFPAFKYVINWGFTNINKEHKAFSQPVISYRCSVFPQRIKYVNTVGGRPVDDFLKSNFHNTSWGWAFLKLEDRQPDLPSFVLCYCCFMWINLSYLSGRCGSRIESSVS